jgi:hypothetical protein
VGDERAASRLKRQRPKAEKRQPSRCRSAFSGRIWSAIGCVGALCINGLECSIRSAVDPKNIRGILTNDRSKISFLR